MDPINQWSEAEPMIEGLQKKESFLSRMQTIKMKIC